MPARRRRAWASGSRSSSWIMARRSRPASATRWRAGPRSIRRTTNRSGTCSRTICVREKCRRQSGHCGMKRFLRTARMVAVIAAALAFTLSSAARAQQVPLQDKPFAEHKIVLQLSDNDPRKQSLVISVANNLLKFYDPDKVAIEVVAFGPGIDLLRSESGNRKLVESLIAQGVRFDVCLNTVDTIERETGRRPEIMPGATP